MSDDKINLEVGVDVHVNDLAQAKALREEFELLEQEITKLARDLRAAANPLYVLARARGQLNAETAKGGRESLDIDRQLYGELKKRFTFERRMTSQRASEESDAAKQVRAEQRETARAFREQMTFNARMARQRAQAEAESERETRREISATARMRDRENKRALADAKTLQRAQQQAAAGAARGAGQVRSGVGRAVTTGGAAAAVIGYGTKRAIDVLTRSGISIDAAINKNTRLSGLNPRDAEKVGADIRKRSMPIARSLGIKTAEYLAARAEAIQAGVEDELVDTVTEFGSKYARLNDMPAAEVMESSGYGITALGAFGKVTADKIKQLFNIQQHLAATTAASRQGLNAFVRRGLSAGAAAGFSLEDTLAYGGAATSSGADGEMAARMLSSTTERLASLPTRAAGIARRKHKTPKDRIFLSLPRKLGFNSWAEVKAAFSKDSAATMEKLYEGLATVSDPRERLELSEDIWGREFGSVHAAMAVGHRFRDMRRSVRSKDAGRAIDSGMSVRAGSFDFIMDQIGSTVQDLKDGLGLVLKPLWAELRDYTLQAPTAFRQFEDAFRMGLRGFMQGLGSRDGTLAGLLRQWFGNPGTFKLDAYGISDFMRGFGQGLRDVGNSILAFIRIFAGQNASPAEMGRWTARILGFSAALLVAAPAVTVLAGLGTAIGGFATVILSTWRLMQAAGIVGAAAGAPKVPVGPGAAATEGWLARFSRLLGIGAFTPTAGLSKPDQDKLIGRLGAYAQEMEKQKQQRNRGWVDPPMRKPVEQLRDQMEKNTEALEESARVQKQAYEALGDAGFRGLIHKASLTGTAGAIGDSIRSGAARAGSPLSGSIGDGDGSAWGTQAGAQINQGLRGHVARLRGNGGGSGGGSSNPAPEGASDPIPGTLNPRLAGSRKALMDELDRDPALRRDVIKTASMENRGSPAKMQAVLESMVNRAKMNGYGSLRQAVHSGFYGPVNRGGLSGALSEKDWRDGEAALAQVRQGSNMIGYRTDQGMLTDPGARRYMREADHSGHRVIGGENYFWMGQKGRQWAKQQEALDVRQGGGDVGQRVAADTKRTQGLGTSLSKPNLGDLDISPQNGLGSRAPLGESVPIRPSSAGSAGGGQGGGHQVHAPITIHSNGGDAQEIASRVQRHLQDAMNRRTHDYDGFA